MAKSKKIVKLKLSQIRENPYNSREDLGDLTGLKGQISRYGMIAPLPVRKSDEGYELAFGSRRLAALKELGKKEAEFAEYSFTHKDMLALSIGENVHRKELTPVEQAKAYEKGIRVMGNVERLAESIDVSSSTISKYLGILRLPKRILKKEQELGSERLYHLSRLTDYSRDVLISAETIADNRHIAGALLKQIVDGCELICNSNLPDKTKITICHKVMMEDYSKLGPKEYSHAYKFAEALLTEALEKYNKRLKNTEKARKKLDELRKRGDKKIKRVGQIVDCDQKMRKLGDQIKSLTTNVRGAHANHYYNRAHTSAKNYFKRWTGKLLRSLDELVEDEE
ncbi:MAG: ParB/RepB/Spo0J family partition protein [Candidatus Thorarchaeota archaeon]